MSGLALSFRSSLRTGKLEKTDQPLQPMGVRAGLAMELSPRSSTEKNDLTKPNRNHRPMEEDQVSLLDWVVQLDNASFESIKSTVARESGAELGFSFYVCIPGIIVGSLWTWKVEGEHAAHIEHIKWVPFFDFRSFLDPTFAPSARWTG